MDCFWIWNVGELSVCLSFVSQGEKGGGEGLGERGGGDGWGERGEGAGLGRGLTSQSVGDCGRPGPNYLVRTGRLDVLLSQETEACIPPWLTVVQTWLVLFSALGLGLLGPPEG